MTFRMQRARMISIPLPKGTKSNLRRRDWGIEISHITSGGNKICTPAPYDGLKEKSFFWEVVVVL